MIDHILEGIGLLCVICTLVMLAFVLLTIVYDARAGHVEPEREDRRRLLDELPPDMPAEKES